MRYAKLDSNEELVFCTYIPNVSNPTEEALKAYALDNGFKEMVYTEQPHRFCHETWTPKRTKIYQEWVNDDLDDTKNVIFDEIQENLNTAIYSRISIPCDLGFNIIYDTQAQMNVMGMIAFGQGGMLIDADDMQHLLSDDEMKVVAKALSDYKTSLYV